MNHIQANELFDLYGPLLTERQQQILSLAIQEDLSYSEISRELNISRAAAQDAVKRAEGLLEQYEEKLGFWKKRNAVLQLVRNNAKLLEEMENIL